MTASITLDGPDEQHSFTAMLIPSDAAPEPHRSVRKILDREALSDLMEEWGTDEVRGEAVLRLPSGGN